MADKPLILILGDQLSPMLTSLAADKDAPVLMAELADEASYVRHHQQKIALIFSAMRHFAEHLRAQGRTVFYLPYGAEKQINGFAEAIALMVKREGFDRLIVTEPGEWRLMQDMQNWPDKLGIEVEILPDSRFIADHTEFERWADGKKQLRMEFFYREMRRKTDLYENIGNDLVTIRDKLSVSDLQTIRDVSTLVYANDLSPESFGHMLTTNDAGLLEAASLPAENDPMLARVKDMRVRHHVFIDTVDEYYGALHDEMVQAYIMWRRHSYDQQEQLVSREQEPVSQDFFSSSSGYLTMTQRYNRYRWSKIYRQEFQELAAGFNQELAPAILELNEQVHGLSGTMAEQYIQWRRILRQLFELETGSI